MAGGSAYTHLVIAAKVILPLIAIAILSMLFLLARHAPQGEPLRFVDEDVQNLAGTQRLGAPVHSSVTDDGSEMTIVAEYFYPDPDRVKVTHGRDLVARILTTDDLTYDITADSGTIDETKMLSTLRDNVVILTSNEYRMTTDAMALRTDLTYLETLAPVHADGPLGTLDAEKMEIFSDPENEMQTRMVFTGGVRLVYTP